LIQFDLVKVIVNFTLGAFEVRQTTGFSCIPFLPSAHHSKYSKNTIRHIHCFHEARRKKERKLTIVSQSVVPRMLPAEQGRTILLGPVHELQMNHVSSNSLKISRETHEEPHASAQCSRREAVERSNRVDVNRVGGCARHDYRIQQLSN
jgi:hypothetical protein